MNERLGKTAGGMLIGGLALGGFRLWRGTRTDPMAAHMPNELLLTVTGAGAHEDETAHILAEKAGQVLHNSGLRFVPSVPAYPEAKHRTLRLHVPPAPSKLRRHQVQEAASMLNKSLDQIQHRNVSAVRAMPNWLVSSSAPTAVFDGPATIPAPVPAVAGNWPFEVPEAGRAPDRPPDPPVVVAVLDTWPGWSRLEDARKRYPDNRLLQELGADGVIVDVEPFTPPDDVPERYSHASADHGLFVAGIVHDIAPHAEIHVLHVLNENGHGRTDLILNGLDYCRNLAQVGRQVVVNLSLYLMIPEPRSGVLMDRAVQGVPPLARALTPGSLDTGVHRHIDELLDSHAVVLAAVGNDSLGRSSPQPARSPARYPSVLGVVATDRSGKIAAYSNSPGPGDSIATFGGQAVLSGSRSVVPPGPEPRDAIVGAFAWPEVHPTGSNLTGWVYWSGTSFATAVMSGIAANVLAQQPIPRDRDRNTSREVIGRINSMADAGDGKTSRLGCPYIHVSQLSGD